MAEISGYSLTEGSFNTCSNCGTINCFDAIDTDMYAKGECYHCGALVDIPEVESTKLMLQQEEQEIKYIRNRKRKIEDCYKKSYTPFL